jgi:hypothetical protein
MFALGIRNLIWCGERAYLTLPPDNLYVRGLAGKKKAVLITLIFDASSCRDREAELHNVSTQFVGTITAVKRYDGAFWYRVSLPLRVSRLLLPFKDCIKVQIFIEPANLRIAVPLGR